MQAKERLYLTADKSALVREGDPRGATLYAAPGDEIPASAVERFGLADGTVAGGAKEAAPLRTKELAPDRTKGDGPDDLTAIKGIGKATAAALTSAGIGTFAELAGVDPASPPEIEATARESAWVSWAAQARVLAVAKPAPAPGGLTVNTLENQS